MVSIYWYTGGGGRVSRVYRKLKTHMPTASIESKRKRQGRPVDGSCHDHTEGLSD